MAERVESEGNSQSPPRRRAWIALGALTVFALVYAGVRSAERAAVDDRAIRAQLDEHGALRPAAEVASAIRAMRLVTVEIETTATSRREHESWRGDVSASVRAPVRLHFGTDLSRMRVDAVSLSPITGTYVVRVPPPERIAAEVDAGAEAADVRVGWGRLRTRAGEYWLGQARRGLSAEARRLSLAPADAARVRDMTRQQVASLVGRIVGPRSSVTVVFEDELPAGLAGTGERP